MINEKEMGMGTRRFHALVQNLGELVTVHDSEGCIQFATPSTARLLGYSEEELIGRNAFELIHPDDMNLARMAFARVMQSENHGVPTEYRVRRSDGAWLDVETVGSNFLKDPVVGGIVLTSRLITERKRHERQLTAVTSVASALRAASNRAEMLPIILDQVISLLSVDGAALGFREPVSGKVLIEAAQGSAQGLLGLCLDAGEGVSGQVIRTGEAYRTADILSDPLYAARGRMDLAGGGPVAAICAPLSANEQTIGVIWIEKQSSPDGIGDEQEQLLVAIAQLSANAIYRATLSEQTERRLHRLIALQTIDLAISRSTDLHVTLNLLLGEITSRLRIDAADVLLVDARDGTLKSAASRGFATAFIAGSRRVLRNGSARMLLERTILHSAEQLRPDLPADLASILLSEGFQSYCSLPLISSGRTVGLLELFQHGQLADDPEWMDYLDGLAAHVALAIEKVSLIQDLQRTNAELMRAYDGVIEGWSRALALRDHETVEHTAQVTEMTLRLASLMGVDAGRLTDIRRGAMLHDIGKIGMPDAVLLQAGPLSDAEREIVQRHPTLAYELMAPIEYLKPALDIPYCHHERWDGSGYPRGLKGDQIPLAAQVFSLIDVYDGLTSDRPYRPACSQKEALDYIREQCGKSFNPEVVNMFLENLRIFGLSG